MKRFFTLCLLSVLVPLSSYSQGGKKPKGPTIGLSTAVNYYSAMEPYTSFNSYFIRDEDLILTFLTANSGTFIIEEGESLYLERTSTYQIPTQSLGFGASVQIKSYNSLFQEISLTKLFMTKTDTEVEYITLDTLGKEFHFPSRGYENQASSFGLRYELGRYFGKNDSKFRFGLSGGCEFSAYFYKMTPKSFQDYPLHAKLFTVELSLNPILSFALSKKISLEFKAIPNFLMGDFGKVEEQNPAFTKRQQKLDRDYSSPELNMAFSVLMRYNIKEPKK